jgi:hypothetical protein
LFHSRQVMKCREPGTDDVSLRFVALRFVDDRVVMTVGERRAHRTCA